MASTATDRRHGLNTSAAVKVPCRVATTANITLSGLQTIDGVALAAADRVLVKDQTTASQNGIYRADTGTWERDKDFDGAYDVVEGTLAMITQGSTNGESMWRVATTGTITPGTTSLSFERAVVNDSSSITFIQSGTATAETVQAVVRRAHFDVKSYGAVGDNATDDTAAIQRAIDAAGSGGIVYFPPGTYKITGVLTVSAGVRFLGAGRTKSIIIGYSASANGFVCSTTEAVSFEKLQITRTGTAATSGAAIQFTHASTENIGSSVEDCVISNWWRGIHFERAQQWRVSHCYIADNYEMGVYIQNLFNADSGDSTIDGGTLFDNSRGGTTYAIFYNSGGGLKLDAVKILSHSYGVFLFLASAATTGVLVIDGCSIEGQSVAGVALLNADSNGAFTHVIISDSEFAGQPKCITTLGGSDFLNSLIIDGCSLSINSGGTCIDLNRGVKVNIGSNVLIANGGAPIGIAVGSVVTNVRIAPQVFQGFTNAQKFSIASASVIVDQEETVGADVGNAAKTLTWLADETTQVWNTPITADRAVTLSTTNALNGAKFRIVRTAAATGAFNLNVGTGPLKAMGTAGSFCEVEYNGSAWVLTAYGVL